MARRVIPGFRLTAGITFFYLSALLLVPLAAFVLFTAEMDGARFIAEVTNYRALHAFALSLGTALAAAVTNAIFGVVIAWVLVRYQFPGRRIMDGLIDLPFALPTAVAGIALTALYAEGGWIGRVFYASGVASAFSPLGITIALVFVGLPFVVRSVQPVLRDLDPELEEAAALLGAGRLRTLGRVILPELLPATVAGFALALARGIGEYGSVVFIAGNLPYETEIAPLLIMAKLEQFDYQAASAIALVLLALSLLILLGLNGYQRRLAAREGSV